jgi:type IX secretion system PorP/SprF family membrane protein
MSQGNVFTHNFRYICYQSMRSLKKKFVYTLLIFLQLCNLHGQDPIYSQYSANPLLLNPAFAGNNYDGRIAGNYRLQWPGISAVYNTFSLSFDKFVESANLSFGFNLLSDDAGQGALTTSRIGGVVGYRVKVNDATFIKGGVDISFTSKKLGWDKFLFYDAISANGGLSPGGSILPTLETQPTKLSSTSMDITTGLLFYNELYYFGIAASHINTPKDAFLVDLRQNYVGTPIRWSLHGGYQFLLDRRAEDDYPTFVTPHIMYARQSNLSQLHLGVNGAWDILTGGLGYRVSGLTGDAAILNLGLRWGNFKASYSFDFTTSDLTINQYGAHELNFGYLIGKRKKLDINDCFKLFE